MNVLRRPGGLQVLWLAVVAALAAWLAATRWDDTSALVDDLSPGPLGVLVAASCLLLVPNAAFWTLALRALGVDRVIRAADLAFLAEPPAVSRDGVLGVCLRAPQSGRLRPGALDAGRIWPDGRAAALAAALDDTCRSTGLTTRFVALDAPADSVVHRQVADRMATPAEVVEPDLDGVVGALARVDAVATMRYHGAVLAALGGAAVVALPHSPKLRSLAAELGPGATVHDDEAEGLAAAVSGVLAGRSHLADAVDRLRTLAGRNVEVLDDLLETA